MPFNDTTQGTTHHDNDACYKCEKCGSHIAPTPQLSTPTKCFSDKDFIYCWCGKCKPKDYPLPEDFFKVVKYLKHEN